MKYLVDTNVVSELGKFQTGRADANVAAWFKQVSDDETTISAVTVFELELWVLRTRRRDPRQEQALSTWLKPLIESYRPRLLMIDFAVATRAAHLHVPDPRPDRDTFIAATALVHGLTVVTRNVKDFAPMGVGLLNPWEWGQ